MPWQIEINSDNTEVILDLKQLKDDDDLTSEGIIGALQEKNVAITDQVKQNISDILQEQESSDKISDTAILAQAEPAVAGENGYFEWAEEFDPEKHKNAKAAEQQEQAAAQRAAAEQAAGKERAAAEWAAVVRAAAVEAAVEAVRRAEEKVSRETEELEARRQELVQLRNENR